jgi:hypothetical protein
MFSKLCFWKGTNLSEFSGLASSSHNELDAGTTEHLVQEHLSIVGLHDPKMHDFKLLPRWKGRKQGSDCTDRISRHSSTFEVTKWGAPAIVNAKSEEIECLSAEHWDGELPLEKYLASRELRGEVNPVCDTRNSLLGVSFNNSYAQLVVGNQDDDSNDGYKADDDDDFDDECKEDLEDTTSQSLGAAFPHPARSKPDNDSLAWSHEEVCFTNILSRGITYEEVCFGCNETGNLSTGSSFSQQACW